MRSLRLFLICQSDLRACPAPQGFAFGAYRCKQDLLLPKAERLNLTFSNCINLHIKIWVEKRKSLVASLPPPYFKTVAQPLKALHTYILQNLGYEHPAEKKMIRKDRTNRKKKHSHLRNTSSLLFDLYIHQEIDLNQGCQSNYLHKVLINQINHILYHSLYLLTKLI